MSDIHKKRSGASIAAEIFDILYNKTLNNDMKWESTANDSVFQASFKNYTIELHYSDQDSPGLDPILMIIDGKGRIIDTVCASELHGYVENSYNKINQLYYYARRSALKADDALIEILKELKGEIDGGNF